MTRDYKLCRGLEESAKTKPTVVVVMVVSVLPVNDGWLLKHGLLLLKDHSLGLLHDHWLGKHRLTNHHALGHHRLSHHRLSHHGLLHHRLLHHGLLHLLDYDDINENERLLMHQEQDRLLQYTVTANVPLAVLKR